MKQQTFELTEEHIKLLRNAYVKFYDAEYGAPAVDCKRPYGNSSVEYDMAEILGIVPEGDEEEDELSEDQMTMLAALHRQTATALQIILATGSFEPGTYVLEGYGTNWKKANVPA